MGDSCPHGSEYLLGELLARIVKVCLFPSSFCEYPRRGGKEEQRHSKENDQSPWGKGFFLRNIRIIQHLYHRDFLDLQDFSHLIFLGERLIDRFLHSGAS